MGNVGGILSGEEENEFLSKRLAHGCNLFISDEKARNAFVKFLKAGSWLDEYTKERLLNQVSTGGDTVTAAENEAKDGPDESSSPDGQLQESFNDYTLPTGTSESEIRAILSSGTAAGDGVSNPEAADVEKIIESCFTQSQMRAVLLATVFPMFLRSSEYQEFVEEQTQNTVVASPTADDSPIVKEGATLAAAIDEKESEDVSEQNREERLDALFRPNEKSIKDLVNEAIESSDPEELDLMLENGDWLRSLMAAVEDLPLCVTLATARDDRRGFPLVYVNKAFENVTQYHRTEIVGKNCNFLQGSQAEPEQVAMMTKALAAAKPVKVAITNARKDGSEFMNLLAMKPVFDGDGVYSYVLGVQYDITGPGASLEQMKTVNDLLSILPNVLK
mmetsp:Transcript_24799/g.41439  ORF Transcript_24799/g.41439 Transcript_24799/m.41439 type:complete len:390 (+) Transcript_24799:122-1291(+)|eukprot:CAMPEP_0174996900 /NCGR_PEP_ID=MMETSP0005-20121125/655_1 /TAXON_ID=420556 /ORGANISM="Ochromonas sp., Strain CCMP1393" /LENGTH=389 /DNA_ID=CAMNT_0016251367 /DNA_START=653 /DNA_END=1822 /DNA_ORIENTATION=+